MSNQGMSIKTTGPISVEERRQLMDAAVIDWTSKGWKAEARSEFQAVFVKGKRPNHILHLLLTIFTAGLWGIVWIILSLAKHEQRCVVSVDEYGNRWGK